MISVTRTFQENFIRFLFNWAFYLILIVIILESGKIYSFGSSGGGKLGNPNVIGFTVFPSIVNSTTISGETIVKISAGHYHTMLLTGKKFHIIDFSESVL